MSERERGNSGFLYAVPRTEACVSRIGTNTHDTSQSGTCVCVCSCSCSSSSSGENVMRDTALCYTKLLHDDRLLLGGGGLVIVGSGMDRRLL